MASNKVALGISLALGAAVSWGAMGIAAQYLLHYCRFEAIDLVSIRLVSAGILLLLIYRILGGTDVMSPFSSRWAFTQVAIAGVTILGSQLTFMLSIKAADAALATILFTVIPLMCAGYYCAVDKKFPSPAICLCFVLASAGVALVVTDGDFSKLNFSVVGLLWGLCSSALCALYSIQPQKVIKKLGVCPVVGWAMIIGGMVACCFNPPWTLQVDWNLNSIAAFTFIVTIGTVLSFWCYLSSVKYLSAVLVSLIGCMEPVTAYILSIMFYGKSVGLYELLGILFVFANVMIISVQSEEKKELKMEENSRSQAIKWALKTSVPVFMGYIPLGVVFGFLFVQAGAEWWLAPLSSIMIYGGAVQYMMIPMLAEGLPISAIAFATFVVNLRHVFYGLSLIDTVPKKGPAKWFLSFLLTDETYSLLTTLPKSVPLSNRLFLAFFNYLWWILGSLIGALLGLGIKVNLGGFDFVLTSLFAMLLCEQWRQRDSSWPVWIALASYGAARLISVEHCLALAIAFSSIGALLLMQPRRKMKEKIYE